MRARTRGEPGGTVPPVPGVVGGVVRHQSPGEPGPREDPQLVARGDAGGRQRPRDGPGGPRRRGPRPGDRRAGTGRPGRGPAPRGHPAERARPAQPGGARRRAGPGGRCRLAADPGGAPDGRTAFGAGPRRGAEGAGQRTRPRIAPRPPAIDLRPERADDAGGGRLAGAVACRNPAAQRPGVVPGESGGAGTGVGVAEPERPAAVAGRGQANGPGPDRRPGPRGPRGGDPGGGRLPDERRGPEAAGDRRPVGAVGTRPGRRGPLPPARPPGDLGLPGGDPRPPAAAIGGIGPGGDPRPRGRPDRRRGALRANSTARRRCRSNGSWRGSSRSARGG